jgi:hypothetical protein
MRKPIFGVLVFMVCLTMTGCGGCGSSVESQMRRAAQRRSAPEDESAPSAAKDKGAKAAEKAGPPAPPVSTAARAGAEPQGATAATVGLGDIPTVAAFNNEKPSQPLTEVERRARSIANMEKIGRALAAYAKKNGKYPPLASSTDGDARLSWRVLILPELGYPELRNRFKNEPWDSRHNKLLLDYIPPEYQSPERFDVKTNYLGVTGRHGLFRDDFESLGVHAVKDGVDNSLAVVEVDDMYAQEWTRPADYTAVFELPGDKLGGLRGEGTFALMASGRSVLLPREMPPSRLAALFTIAGGEPVSAATSLAPPTAEPPPPMLAAIADDPAAANQSDLVDTSVAPASAPAAAPVVFPGAEPGVAIAGREEIPSEEALAKARELLKELYGKDFQQARSPEDQRKFLKRLAASIADVQQNAADYHELVRIIRDLAVSLGDVSQALAACELMEQRFQVDSLTMRLSLLESVSSRAGELRSVEPALKEGQRLWRAAFEADRYDVAVPACEVTLSFARIQGIRTEVTRLHEQVNSLSAANSLYGAAQRAFEKLQTDSGDATANEAVGRYVCLVKNRWTAGLPYLSKAADIRLRGIASLELATDRSLAETLSLAEQYWELAGRTKPPQRRGLHLRAVHCYGLVGPKLAGGLEKLNVQRRIDEAAGIYGRKEIDRVLAPLAPQGGSSALSASAN